MLDRLTAEKKMKYALAIFILVTFVAMICTTVKNRRKPAAPADAVLSVPAVPAAVPQGVVAPGGAAGAEKK